MGYVGNAIEPITGFESQEYPIPVNTNRADHYLDNADFTPHCMCANQESKSGGYDDKTDYSKSKLARSFCSKIVIMLCRLGVLAFREPHFPLREQD
eukprot:967773-Amphidinium_carterae.2